MFTHLSILECVPTHVKWSLISTEAILKVTSIDLDKGFYAKVGYSVMALKISLLFKLEFL